MFRKIPSIVYAVKMRLITPSRHFLCFYFLLLFPPPSHPPPSDSLSAPFRPLVEYCLTASDFHTQFHSVTISPELNTSSVFAGGGAHPQDSAGVSEEEKCELSVFLPLWRLDGYHNFICSEASGNSHFVDPLHID